MMKHAHQLLLIPVFFIAFFSSQVYSYGLGGYSQAGVGISFVPEKKRSGYYDAAKHQSIQAGLLYNSMINNKVNSGHHVSIGYEYTTRTFENDSQIRSGSSISYAYISKLKQWSNAYLWIGPLGRLVFYNNKYKLDTRSASDSINFGFGPIFGINHRYNNQWTLSYFIEATNLDAFFTDVGNSGESEIISLQANIALYYRIPNADF